MDASITSSRPRPSTRGSQAGPPPGVLAAVSTALLVAGLVVSAVLGGTVPSPYAGATVVRDYFGAQSDAALAGGVLVFASSVPLALYAATMSARLRQLGVTAPGATIALAGGVLAAGALALSGLFLWVLSRPGIAASTPVLRALHDLAFLTGGVTHVVFLGLLVAGVAVPALVVGLLPRPLAWAGLVVAAVAELATLSLLVPALSVLLPLARFPGLAWLVAAGFLLPHRRPRTTPRP